MLYALLCPATCRESLYAAQVHTAQQIGTLDNTSVQLAVSQLYSQLQSYQPSTRAHSCCAYAQMHAAPHCKQSVMACQPEHAPGHTQARQPVVVVSRTTKHSSQAHAYIYAETNVPPCNHWLSCSSSAAAAQQPSTTSLPLLLLLLQRASARLLCYGVSLTQ